MRTLLRCTVACLAFAGMAHAQGDALIVGNGNYSVLDRLTGAAGVLEANEALKDEGFEVVSLGEAKAGQLRAGLSRFIDRLDADTDRVAVILSGRFVHSATDTYFLPVDVNAPLRVDEVLEESLALSKVLGLLAAFPGRALLILGEDTDEAPSAPFLRAGAGPVTLPQGVTLMRGTPDAVARLARRDLAIRARTLVATARALGLQVEGYAPDDWVFLPAPPARAEVVLPRPIVPRVDQSAIDAEARAWAAATSRDDLAGYRSYLTIFPEGARANEARQRIRAIEADPFRDARLAEEALNLSRDARREIQRQLTLLDYNTRGIDGIFGPGTRGAVKSWQARNGFAQSGFLDREQILRLDGQATRRAAELAEEARQRQAELERRDRAFWEETGARGDVAGFRAYLERYPDGVYAEVAQERLDAIEADRSARAAARDREAWEAAQRDGRVQAYQGYLADYPDGAFADQARAQIAELQRPSGEREAIARAAAQEAALNLNAGARRIAEQRLASLGLKPGEVDGVFDKKTRRAIRRYQEARGLSVTGYLDQATVVRLLAESLLR